MWSLQSKKKNCIIQQVYATNIKFSLLIYVWFCITSNTHNLVHVWVYEYIRYIVTHIYIYICVCGFYNNINGFYIILCLLWRKVWQRPPVLLPRKSHEQRTLEDYSPWDREESDTTEQLTHMHMHTLTSNKNWKMCESDNHK